MDLSVLGEMAIGAVARLTVVKGLRALLAQEADIVEQAIAETSNQFKGIEAEPALKQWAASPDIDSIYERLCDGERDFGGEIVESFITVGNFYYLTMPISWKRSSGSSQRSLMHCWG